MIYNIVALIITCILSLAIAYICVPANKYKFAFIAIAFIAVLLRIAMVFYIYRNGTDTFGTDGLLYHKEGIVIAGQLKNGVSAFGLDYSYTWYTVFIGLVYYLLGTSRYIISFINILFAITTGMILLKIALNHKYRFRNAAFISLSFLYFPNLALWTADTRKESLLILVCCLVWFSVQNLIISIKQKGNMLLNYLRIIFICLLLWLSTLIRLYMFIPLMIGVITCLLIFYIKKRYAICLVFIAAVIVSALFILVATMYPLTFDYHAVTFPKEETSSIVQDATNKIAAVQSIISKRNLLVSLMNYLILPYPGNIDIADIKGSWKATFFVQLDMIAWYICLILIPSGIYAALKKRDSCFVGLLAFITTYILINAMLVENVSDTILRYRSVIVGLMILFIDGNVIGNFLKKLNTQVFQVIFPRKSSI